MNTYDPDFLRQEFRKIQSGEPRMRAIRSAIAEAELAGDREAQVEFHHDLIHESVFSGDRYQALIDFPQYLAAIEASEEPEQHRWDMVWTYKWIVEAANEFWQIPRKQVMQWFNHFRAELTQGGWSLRPFFQKRTIFFSYCDRARLRLDYDDFLAAPVGPMCDGRAEDLNTVIRWELEIGSREKALSAAQEIFDGGFQTEEIPSATYGYLLADALRRSDREEADRWAKLLLPCCEGRRFRLEWLGLLLCYYAVTSPEEGLALLRRCAGLREGSRNPFLCFWYDRGASRVIRAAEGAGLPVTESAEEAENSVRDLAAKFDERNRSDYFSRAAAEEYHF